MNTPYWRKAASLAGALARSPRHAAAWVTHLPAWGRWPVDVELPWWSYGSIDWASRYLRPTHRVFEYGSGGSSLYLARRAASVLAVENDPAWHRLLTETATRRGLANLTCELHPLADDSLVTFQASSFGQRVTAGTWDVIVIDCHCGFNAAPFGVIRPAAMAVAMPQVAPGGIIVLDDSWMYPELLVPRAGWEIQDFVGVGPCRYGVTSTAILRRLS